MISEILRLKNNPLYELNSGINSMHRIEDSLIELYDMIQVKGGTTDNIINESSVPGTNATGALDYLYSSIPKIHNQLLQRDENDCHPIEAITGLSTTIDQLIDSDNSIRSSLSSMILSEEADRKSEDLSILNKISALESNVLTKTNTSSYTPTSDFNPSTKKYVDDSISELGSVLVFKDIVPNINLLPLSGNKKGDVYLVGPNEDGECEEYVWISDNSTGTINDWEKFGTTTKIDLSGYYTKGESDALYVKLQSNSTQIINSNIALGKDSELLGTDNAGSQHVIGAIKTYDINGSAFVQNELSNETNHTNINSSDRPTIETPLGKEDIAYTSDIKNKSFIIPGDCNFSWDKDVVFNGYNPTNEIASIIFNISGVEYSGSAIIGVALSATTNMTISMNLKAGYSDGSAKVTFNEA